MKQQRQTQARRKAVALDTKAVERLAREEIEEIDYSDYQLPWPVQADNMQEDNKDYFLH